MYRELDKLQPNFKKKVEYFLEEVGDKVFITESWRSQERQKELYAQGRTKPGPIVTWTLRSKHTEGLAIDIAFKGAELYPNDINKWKEIGKVATKYGIDWGYDMWGKDRPHFQDGKPIRISEKDDKILNVIMGFFSKWYNYTDNMVIQDMLHKFNKTARDLLGKK